MVYRSVEGGNGAVAVRYERLPKMVKPLTIEELKNFFLNAKSLIAILE